MPTSRRKPSGGFWESEDSAWFIYSDSMGVGRMYLRTDGAQQGWHHYSIFASWFETDKEAENALASYFLLNPALIGTTHHGIHHRRISL